MSRKTKYTQSDRVLYTKSEFYFLPHKKIGMKGVLMLIRLNLDLIDENTDESSNLIFHTIIEARE